MPEANPYEYQAHKDWVAGGKCSSISRSKAWCNGDQGHAEDHHAPYLHPGGREEPVFWTDAQEWPRPKEATA